ncbi:dolichyl-diphosphooligosaccharide-protein glycosyltransferase 48kDa subunit family protein [Actinidia rufa]|uniref:Dolichyl-diphosphooligosaccharide--protein glycosyltransferase 48 kDa subunit n=1 Tax=Actinidia rufa TaxID=165716 RepID=A0A7J0ET52_9ERIC|nr:dolichyl-diphosphooligosaccharide-protein glycosyltransferase 48kDa subunit family protein [Actinidia rufa]
MSRPPLIFFAAISLVATLCSSFSPDHPTNRRILVLLDDLAIQSSHSLFFNSLQSRGFELDFKLADDPKIGLKRYGQYLYDGLIIFSPTIERFGGSVDLAAIVDFVDSGRDLIIAADTSASDLIREIAAAECGVDFDEASIILYALDQAAMVIDHTSYAVSDTEGGHTLIASDDFIQSDVILGRKKIEGLKVLSASPSAYSANPKAKLSNPPSLIGSAISLVSVVQARNNARVLISGSLSLFSNRFLKSGVQKAGSSIKHAKSGNEQFLTELSKWVFHERGHLKAVNVRHHKVGEADEPAMYRINDDLEYSVEIYEWSGKSWEPYVANDVQVQFYMMSPYVLKTLSTDQKGLYFTAFKVPDVYGVFQFKVEYQQLGYTGLSLSKQMAGFFVFTVVYSYNKQAQS